MAADPRDRRKPRKPLESCQKCGKVHERDGLPTCAAHQSKNPGVPCGKFPKHGMRVCGNHGGSAKQVERVADENIKRAEAERQAAKMLAGKRDIAGADAITEMVQMSAFAVGFYAEMVANLGEDVTQETMFGPSPNIWVKLWNEERERLVKFAAVEVNLGLQERRLELEQLAGQRIAALIRAFLDDPDMEFSDAQRTMAPAVLRRNLKTLNALSATATKVA